MGAVALRQFVHPQFGLIDRHARRVLHSPQPKLRAKSQDDQDQDQDESEFGWIEGYAAVWGNIDAQNEIMQRGCFARSISQAVPAWRVKLMVKHFCNGGDVVECIGTVTEAREDDFGLWIHAELSSVQLAQDTRTKILEGHVQGLSVGYKPIRWDFSTAAVSTSTQVLVHQEDELCEVTVTVKPVNAQTIITAAKTEGSVSASSQLSQSTGGKTADNAQASVVTSPDPAALQRMRQEIDLRRAELFQLFNS